MVDRIAVRMEIALEILEELLRILCSPARLVFIQHDGLVRVAACPVQPQATRLMLLPRLIQELQGCLVHMEGAPLEQLYINLWKSTAFYTISCSEIGLWSFG